jgi:hypothetical protein
LFRSLKIRREERSSAVGEEWDLEALVVGVLPLDLPEVEDSSVAFNNGINHNHCTCFNFFLCIDYSRFLYFHISSVAMFVIRV